jgi:hypothetical protein
MAQTTQGEIMGRVLDSVESTPLNARIECTQLATLSQRLSTSGASGYYNAPLLPPGKYRVRVEADGYQSQEIFELELPVAGRLELDFWLQPLRELWGAGTYRTVRLAGSDLAVTFFGPDIDYERLELLEPSQAKAGVLEATVSYVVDPEQIESLPLAGRDVYTILLAMPGVASESGTARGIGLSVVGERAAATNFLLDGVSNNNRLITGPLAPVPAEAIQEYRVSTNNFSAEYGGTSGFIANAVTRSGGSGFHGLAYFDVRNEVLNANGFQENLKGMLRRPAKELQFGYQTGGPVVKEVLFWSSAFERLHSRSRLDPTSFMLPDPALAKAPIGRSLLQQFPASGTGSVMLSQPVSVDRYLTLERLDFRRGRDQAFARVAYAKLSRPDFIWSPYRDFTSGLNQPDASVALNYQRQVLPWLFNEAAAGFNFDHLSWDRAHPEIPTLVVQIPADFSQSALPGSPAFYTYSNRNRSWEVLDHIAFTRGRHAITAGGGGGSRTISGSLGVGRDGRYTFNAVSPNNYYGNFYADQISGFLAGAQRGNAKQQPDFNRTYEERNWFVFAQDTFRLTPRLVLNFGLRYERFGGPSNTGATPDTLVQVQPGTTIWQQSALVLQSEPQVYRSNGKDWGPRFGVSWDTTGSGRTVVRGGYGIFYDHPFDNLWQTARNNAVQAVALVPFPPPPPTFNYLGGVPSALTTLSLATTDFPKMTLFDPNFRDGYAQTFFVGVEQRITKDLTLAVNGMGSLGRRLVTTDIINRSFTIGNGRLDSKITTDISYRAPQGSSHYTAATVLVRGRSGLGQWQAAYTWGRAIDNQSEALSADDFNLSYTGLTPPGSSVASFSKQFDSSSDRGNSDFDQRHNFVFYSIWNLPQPARTNWAGPLLRNWRFAQLAAFRSGFPYTVYSNGRVGAIMDKGLISHNRADLLDPAAATPPAVAVTGGERLLNAAAFQQPANDSVLGNSGRNAFEGPGLYSLDISLSRSFGVRRLGESGRVTLRADAFNALNHANLGAPDADLSHTKGATPSFGIASFGRKGRPTGFPAVFPLDETARQIQLIVRVQF